MRWRMGIPEEVKSTISFAERKGTFSVQQCDRMIHFFGFLTTRQVKVRWLLLNDRQKTN
jgi:hypothetical protein